METIPLTPQMVAVLCMLALTVVLFVTEVVRLDVAGLSVLVLLGLLTLIPPLEGLVDARELFVGFSSNAVISIIAVMILGAGLNRTGLVMSRLLIPMGFCVMMGGTLTLIGRSVAEVAMRKTYGLSA